MSLPVPLSVRLQTNRADRNITALLRDLSYSHSVPGGFRGATLSFDRPLNVQPDEVAHFGKVYITDVRNGGTCWEGRLQVPGRAAGNGQIWQLTAVGPSAHASDRTVPLIYADRDLAALKRYNVNLIGATNGVKEDPGGTGKQGLVLQFPQGITSFVGAEIRMRYSRILNAGQKLARVDYQWRAGGTDVNFSIHFMVGTGGSLSQTPRTQTLAPSSGFDPKVIGTDWTAGHDTLDFHHENAGPGSGAIPNDGFWASLLDVVIMATRFSAAGTELTSGSSYTTNTVLASDIVADLLGRLLTQYDGANAAIAATSFGIEQLAFPDGIDAVGVFEVLMGFEPGFFWAAWETPWGRTKYRFEWSQWPTAVRYEASIVDGFEAPAGWNSDSRRSSASGVPSATSESPEAIVVAGAGWG